MRNTACRFERIINGGGIRSESSLNQAYANVLGKRILVPNGDVTSLGSAIFAFLAAGAFRTVEEAQDALCPGYHEIEPDTAGAAIYQESTRCTAKLFRFWCSDILRLSRLETSCRTAQDLNTERGRCRMLQPTQ